MADRKGKTGRTREAARQQAGATVLARTMPRVRLKFPNGVQLGPGKADLLDAVGRTGSISAAGRTLGMSYRRAWLLVDEVNGLFDRPVVTASAGGAHGGGAQLTDFGRALIAAFRRIEERARIAMREELAPFETDLREIPDHPPSP